METNRQRKAAADASTVTGAVAPAAVIENDEALPERTFPSSSIPWLTRPPIYCLSTRIGVLHPRSRGWVKLRSTDPRDKPRILFNMYDDPEDMATMIRGLHACRDVFAQSPLREMISHEVAPGAKVRVYGTNDLSFTNLDQAYAQIYSEVSTGAVPSLHQVSLSYGLGETYATGAQMQTGITASPPAAAGTR